MFAGKGDRVIDAAAVFEPEALGRLTGGLAEPDEFADLVLIAAEGRLIALEFLNLSEARVEMGNRAGEQPRWDAVQQFIVRIDDDVRGDR